MLMSEEKVVQVIDRAETALFVKQVVHVQSDDAPLVMVRKFHPERRTGTPLLLLHGFGQNRYAWHLERRSFVNYLASRGWDVFNMDLRGQGRSREMGSSAPQAFDEYVMFDVPSAAEEICRLTGQKHVFLAGHSMGGLVAYCAGATKLRHEVQGIITLGTPYHFASGSAILKPLARLFRTLRYTGVFEKNPELPMKFLTKQLQFQRRLLDQTWLPFPIRIWTPGSIEPEVLIEFLQRSFDASSAAVALAIVHAGLEEKWHSADGTVDYSTSFENFDVPLLIIAGQNDSLVPPSSVRPAYELSRSHDKTFVEVPFGHIDILIGSQAPLDVWPRVDRWLRAHTEKPSELDQNW